MNLGNEEMMWTWLNLRKCDAGDTVEAKAIKTLFGEHAASGNLAISSTKVRHEVKLEVQHYSKYKRI